MIDLTKITVPVLERTMRHLGYAWFTADTKPCNLNLVGIRHTSRESNRFDDAIVCAWRYRGQWSLRKWRATTDPGTYWLLRLMNPRGAAILVRGQYRGVYRIDLHSGRYEALCQRGGPVKVYRDRTMDTILDLDPRTHHVGWFGINIHRAQAAGITQWVNNHSAGCQVLQSANDFAELMDLARTARRHFGNSFTYTLLHEEELRL